MLLRKSTILTHGSSEALMGGSFHFMKIQEQMLTIISNDFIRFWHMMPWPHHLDPSVRMAGSPQAWWQATSHQQPGAGRRGKVGGAELAEYCCYQANTVLQLDHLANLPFFAFPCGQWESMTNSTKQNALKALKRTKGSLKIDWIGIKLEKKKKERKVILKNGNPLQYSCLENPMDRGAWWATVHGFAELDTTEQVTFSLSFHSQRMLQLYYNL